MHFADQLGLASGVELPSVSGSVNFGFVSPTGTPV
jgi:hypothetical protein